MSQATSKDYEMLYEEAENYLAAGDFERGIALLAQASMLAESLGEIFAQGAILNNLALAQKHAGQTNASLDTIIKAVDLLRRAGAQAELAEALRNQGFIERELGNLDAAIQNHKDAFTVFEAINDGLGMAKVLIDMGLDYKDQSQLTAAHASFERALALLADYIEPGVKAHALIGLGLTSEKLHNIKCARQYYLKALKAYREAGDRENEAMTLHNLGQLFDNQQKYQIALDYYRQSLEINLEIDSKWGMISDLSSLAAIYQVTGDPEQSRQMHEQALNLQEEIGDRLGQVWTYIDLGILVRDAGQFNEAERYLAHALRLAREIGDPHEIYNVHFNLGDTHMLGGYLFSWNNIPGNDNERLIELLIQKLRANWVKTAKIEKINNGNTIKISSENNSLFLKLNYGIDREFLTINDTRADEFVVMAENDERGVYLASRLNDAANNYTAAVDALESVRHRLLLEKEAMSYFDESHLEAYDRLVRLYVRGLSNPTQALMWEERAKAREFLRRLRLSDISKPYQIPKELIDRETQLLARLRQTAYAISTASESNRLVAVKEYESVEITLRGIWTAIKPFNPEYVALRYGEPVLWEDIQKCLRLRGCLKSKYYM